MTQAGSDHYIKQSKLVAILHPKDEKHEAWCRGGDRKFPPVPNQVSQQSHQHQGPSPKIPRKGACHGAVIGVHEFSCHNEEAHNGSPCICNHNSQSESRKILKRANESSKKKNCMKRLSKSQIVLVLLWLVEKVTYICLTNHRANSIEFRSMTDQVC